MRAPETTSWHSASWQSRPAQQQPVYADARALERIVAQISRLPPIVVSWEVEALRAKLAQAASGQGDAAAKAKELDAKLAAFGGAVTGRGGRGGGFGGGGRGGATEPGAMQSFLALNNAFSAIVSAMQVGLDMAPTKAKIATWETDCKNYNTTVTAWKKAVSDDLDAFNVPASKVTTASCTFAPTATTAAAASTAARGR